MSGCKDAEKDTTKYTRIATLTNQSDYTVKSFWVYGIDYIKISFADNSGDLYYNPKVDDSNPINVYCVSETPILKSISTESATEFLSNSTSSWKGFLAAWNGATEYDLNSNANKLYSSEHEKFCTIDIRLKVVKDAEVTVTTNGEQSEVVYYQKGVPSDGWTSHEINVLYTETSYTCQTEQIKEITYSYKDATEKEKYNATWKTA